MQTDRQADRHTDMMADRDTNTLTYIHTYRHREGRTEHNRAYIHRDGHTYRQKTYKQTGRARQTYIHPERKQDGHANRQADTDRLTGRLADIQTARHTGRDGGIHTHMRTYIHTYIHPDIHAYRNTGRLG